MKISNEIKALLWMQAKDEISDGYYATVQSHGEGYIELEQELLETYESYMFRYELSFEELEESYLSCR